MTPNLIMDLQIEPTLFMWNGHPVTLPGKYKLLPDNEVRYLHKRVVAIPLHERARVPISGIVVGQAKYMKNHVWLVEDERGRIIKTQMPMEV